MSNKKINFLFWGTILFFLFEYNVLANELKFTVSTATNANNIVKKGDKVNVIVSLKSDIAIASCIFKITSNNNIENTSKGGIDNWIITGEGEEGILIENNNLDMTPLISGKNILSLDYTINDSGTITIETKECVSINDDLIGSHEDIVLKFDINNSNNNDNINDSNNNDNINDSNDNDNINDSNIDNNIENPQTGNIKRFIVIILLFISLISSLIVFKKRIISINGD